MTTLTPEQLERLRFRSELLTTTAERLAQIERCSELATEDFCKSILSLAANDAILRTQLERNRLTVGVPKLQEPRRGDLPIEVQPLGAANPTGV